MVGGTLDEPVALFERRLATTQERRRLELQLQERGREAARLRGVISELEATLAEAYRRQADW